MAGFGTFAHYAGKCLDKWKGIAGLAGVSYASYHIASGNGLAGAAINAGLGSDVKKAVDQRGLWGGILKFGTGNENADKDAIDAGAQLAQSMGEKARDMAGSVAQHMGGMVNPQQPEMPQNVPAMGQYAIDQNQAAAIYQAMCGQQMQQQQGGLSGIVNNIAGNKTSMWGIAEIAAAAWMMFGNFGWMGKIVGAVLGNIGVKNLGILGGQPRQQVAYAPMQQYGGYQTPQQYFDMMMDQDDRQRQNSGIVLRST